MITVTLSEVEREVLCEALAQFDAPPEMHEIVARLGDKLCLSKSSDVTP